MTAGPDTLLDQEGGADETSRPRGAGCYPAADSSGWSPSSLFFAGAAGYALSSWQERQPGSDSVNVGFLQDMISHHEQAIQMSNIELAAGTVRASRCSRARSCSFKGSIGLMHRKLDEWGYRRENRDPTAMAWMGMPTPVDDMPGMASAAEMDRLGDATAPAVDALFVRLMQDHHRGGVHMAACAAEHASDPLVRQLAARMARNQRIEINELDGALEWAGLDPTPPGWEPAEILGGAGEHSGHGS